jgi:hypothetical protein
MLHQKQAAEVRALLLLRTNGKGVGHEMHGARYLRLKVNRKMKALQ